MNQQYNFEKVFNCEKQMDILEKQFDEFTNKNKYKSTKNKLQNIKSFLYKQEKERLKIFKGTHLAYSDCFVLSTLTQMLAKRKGIELEIARPKKLTRAMHALLVYRENGKIKSFEIAGKRKNSKIKILTEKNIRKKIKWTRPFVNPVRALLIKKRRI